MNYFYFLYVKFYLELCLYLSFPLFGSLKKTKRTFFLNANMQIEYHDLHRKDKVNTELTSRIRP